MFLCMCIWYISKTKKFNVYSINLEHLSKINFVQGKSRTVGFLAYSLSLVESLSSKCAFYFKFKLTKFSSLLITFFRKASCEQGIQLKAVHRHQCDLANGAFDYEQHGSNKLVDQTPSEIVANEDQHQQNKNQFNVEQEVQPSNFNETNSQILISKEDNGQQQTRTKIEECKAEQYELMKFQILQKGKISCFNFEFPKKVTQFMIFCYLNYVIFKVLSSFTIVHYMI